MKWNAKVKPEKPEPVLGDKKERVWFAVLPVKVESKWLWLEKYIVLLEFKEWYYDYEEVVESGIIFEKYRTVPVRTEGWRRVGRKLISK